MGLRRMVMEPQFTIYVSSTMRIPPRSVHGHEYRFVTVKPEGFFGLTQIRALWASRLGHQMEALPEYDAVFRTVRRELRQAGFPE
jgi:hypothetical protein